MLVNFCHRAYRWFLSVVGLLIFKECTRNHGIKDEFVFLAKPILLCIIGRRILRWSVFAIEPTADFAPFWGCWPSKNGSCDHDVKGEFVSLAKTFVYGTTGKRILCWLVIAIDPIADFSLFLGCGSSTNGSPNTM